MNSVRKIVVMFSCLGLMLEAGGCANKDVVKKDEQFAGKVPAIKPTLVSAEAVADPVHKKEDSKNSTSVVQPVPEVGTTTYPQQSTKAVVNSNFDKIYFDFDSSNLSKSSRDILSRSAEILMKDQKDAIVRIEGNCDERGSAEYNLALGERRAKAAAKYLTALGVQAERLFVLSYGKEKPAVQGNDEAAWSKNRRDEFVVQK